MRAPLPGRRLKVELQTVKCVANCDVKLIPKSITEELDMRLLKKPRLARGFVFVDDLTAS